MMKRSTILLLSALVAVLFVAPQLRAAVSIDVTTAGDWIGTYGNDGYILPYYLGSGYMSSPPSTLDLTSLPNFVTGYGYADSERSGYKWGSGTNSASAWFARSAADPRPGVTTRETCIAYRADSMTVGLSLAPDAPSFQMAVYAYHITTEVLDQTIAAQWQGETTPFDSAALNAYQTGQWAVFDIDPNGKTQLDIILTRAASSASADAMIQGIMFDAVPEPGITALLCCGLLTLSAIARRKQG
ncbi:MAG: hypothetical protein JXM70_19080 [Pirellulales bacterium]|nr:hypothetical protein [Pirellulales bacterium]